MSGQNPTNEEIADILNQIADLLEMQEANDFRVQAYRKGAQSVKQSKRSVAEIAQKGADHLKKELQGVGKSLARVIEDYIRTGRSGLLDRLQGEISPEKLFQKVPGIGDEMAHRVASELDIDSLEELEQAAHDGRLEKVEGFGAERVKGIRESLAGMLSRSAKRRAKQRSLEKRQKENEPPVDLILDVDKEYRHRAKKNDLKKIAPRRFNPDNKAWLPILHTERDDWSFTTLYSNTAKAHELGTTHDWVVIYYDQDGEEGQCTVVTKKSGKLKGKRVIRGREQECQAYYESDSRDD